MIFKKIFVSVPTKELFEVAKENDVADKDAIAFIEEPREIWALGQYYPCPYTKVELDNLLNRLYFMPGIIDKASYTTDDEIKKVFGDFKEFDARFTNTEHLTYLALGRIRPLASDTTHTIGIVFSVRSKIENKYVLSSILSTDINNNTNDINSYTVHIVLESNGTTWTKATVKGSTPILYQRDVKNDLTSTDTNKPLSANQGKVLDEKLTQFKTELTNKIELEENRAEQEETELDLKIDVEKKKIEEGLKSNFYEIKDFTINDSPTELQINDSIGTYEKAKAAIEKGAIILVNRGTEQDGGKVSAAAYKDDNNNLVITYPHFDNNDWTVLTTVKAPVGTIASDGNPITKSEVHIVKPHYVIVMNKTLKEAVATDIQNSIKDAELKEALTNSIPSFMKFTNATGTTVVPVSIWQDDKTLYITWIAANYAWLYKKADTATPTLTKMSLDEYKAGIGLNLNDHTFNLVHATNDTLGGIKIGYAENGTNYPIELNEDKAFVNVPYTTAEQAHAVSSTYIAVTNANRDALTTTKGIAFFDVYNNGWSDDDNADHNIFQFDSGKEATQIGVWDSHLAWRYNDDPSKSGTWPAQFIRCANMSDLQAEKTRATELEAAIRNEFAQADKTLKGELETAYKAADQTLKTLLTEAYTAADSTLKLQLTTGYTEADKTLKSQLETAYKAADKAISDDLTKVKKIIDENGTLDQADAALLALGEHYKDLVSIATTLKQFMEDSDTANSTINRWKEIESFLQGVSDTESLSGLLEELKSELTTAYKNADTAGLNSAKQYADQKDAALKSTLEAAYLAEDAKKVAKAGDTMTGSLLFTGDNIGIKTKTSNRENAVYAVLLLKEDPYGVALLLGAGGNTLIGSGESPANVYNKLLTSSSPISGGEHTYVISDSDLHLLTNTQNIADLGLTVAKEWLFNTDGNIVPPKGGNFQGNSSTATKLATARDLHVDLTKDYTTEANRSTFDGSANKVLPVTGVLPVANGGTGANNLNNVTVGNATHATKADTATTASKVALKLIFTGASSVAYDGSAALTVNIPVAASAVPLVSSGSGNKGTSTKYALEDHVHPAQPNITGNASTATKLAKAVNLDISDSADTPHKGTATSFDGSANATLKLPTTIKATLLGNASTATKLAAQQLSNGADLNNNVTAGIFYYSGNPTEASFKNIPNNLTNGFLLEVFDKPGCLQVLYQWSTNNIWVRSYYNSTWTTWALLALNGAWHKKATSTALGEVKLGSDTVLTDTPQGVTSTANRTYNVLMNSNQQLLVNVPWVNTTYGNATSSQAGLMSGTDKAKLDGIADNANNYTLPKATTTTLGGVKLGSDTALTATDKVYPVQNDSNGLMKVQVPWQNTTYKDATSSSSGLMSSTDKAKLDGIVEGANKYVLPLATTSVLGGVKLGNDTVQSSAVVTPSTATNRTYPILKDSNGRMVVNVPWTDADTKYTLPTATSSVLGGVKLGSDTAQSQVANEVSSTASRTYSILKNSGGQLVVNVPWIDTKYSAASSSQNGLMTKEDKAKLDGIASGATKYTLPAATDTTLGGVKLGNKTVLTVVANSPSTTASRTYPIQFNSSNQLVVNVPWQNTTYGNVSDSSAGLMTPDLLKKLNGFKSGYTSLSDFCVVVNFKKGTPYAGFTSVPFSTVQDICLGKKIMYVAMNIGSGEDFDDSDDCMCPVNIYEPEGPTSGDTIIFAWVWKDELNQVSIKHETDAWASTETDGTYTVTKLIYNGLNAIQTVPNTGIISLKLATAAADSTHLPVALSLDTSGLKGVVAKSDIQSIIDASSASAYIIVVSGDDINNTNLRSALKVQEVIDATNDNAPIYIKLNRTSGGFKYYPVTVSYDTLAMNLFWKDYTYSYSALINISDSSVTVSKFPLVTSAGAGLLSSDYTLSVKIGTQNAPSGSTKVTLVTDDTGLAGYVSDDSIKSVASSVAKTYKAGGGLKLSDDNTFSIKPATASPSNIPHNAEVSFATNDTGLWGGVNINYSNGIEYSVPFVLIKVSSLPAPSGSTAVTLKADSNGLQGYVNNTDIQSALGSSDFIKSTNTTLLSKISVVTSLPTPLEAGVLYLVVS